MAVVDLLEIPRDSSGQVLQLLTVLADEEDLLAFGAASGRPQPRVRADLLALIAHHEADERLVDERSIGRLRPARDRLSARAFSPFRVGAGRTGPDQAGPAVSAAQVIRASRPRRTAVDRTSGTDAARPGPSTHTSSSGVTGCRGCSISSTSCRIG